LITGIAGPFLTYSYWKDISFSIACRDIVFKFIAVNAAERRLDGQVSFGAVQDTDTN